jgi:hypothetical protein
MPNTHKAELLANLTTRFGRLRKIAGSDSLFTVGDDAARIYLRYSKVHSNGRTFFGLREVDLRQLEGHNAFLCFFADDGSLPLFVPYADFEEIFHNAESAKDGQYKVQLIEGIARELYIAREGRFNVEGYVGYELLARSLDAKRLRPAMSLTHPQIQTLLGAIGRSKGYDVWIPACDVNSLDWSVTVQFPVRKSIPKGFEAVRDILCEIDVVWVAPGRDTITGLFEVEHSTPVYSGLLRFNDVLLTEPRLSRFAIVSNDERRAVFSKQLRRPTFVRSGLSEITSFLEYANVVDWHARVVKGAAANYV